MRYNKKIKTRAGRAGTKTQRRFAILALRFCPLFKSYVSKVNQDKKDF